MVTECRDVLLQERVFVLWPWQDDETGTHRKQRRRCRSVKIDVWVPWKDGTGDLVSAICPTSGFPLLLGKGRSSGRRGGHNNSAKWTTRWYFCRVELQMPDYLGPVLKPNAG